LEYCDTKSRHRIVGIVSDHTSSIRAVSATVRSWTYGVLGERDRHDAIAANQTPCWAESNQLLAEEGERMEPPVSEPVPAAAKFAATAAPVPPEEPLRPGQVVGIFHLSASELTEMPPLANSAS